MINVYAWWRAWNVELWIGKARESCFCNQSAGWLQQMRCASNNCMCIFELINARVIEPDVHLNSIRRAMLTTTRRLYTDKVVRSIDRFERCWVSERGSTNASPLSFRDGVYRVTSSLCYHPTILRCKFIIHRRPRVITVSLKFVSRDYINYALCVARRRNWRNSFTNRFSSILEVIVHANINHKRY